MKSLARWTAWLLLLAPLSQAQQAKLVVSDTAVSPTLGAGPVVVPLRCDDDLNVFFRPFSAQERPLTSPVLKLDKHATLQATFSLMSSPELAGMVSGDFFPTPDGELHELAWVPGKRIMYVLNFGKDGAFKSKVALERGFQPAQLAVFPKGEFLATGLEPTQWGQTERNKPFTALFNSSGKLIKMIRLEDDERITKAAASGDTDYVSSPTDHGNRAVELGDVAMGADGNAYLMRRTNPTIVYAISPGGEVVRRLSIDPGNPRMMPQAIHAAKGRLVIMYSIERAINFVVVDPTSGDVLVRYDSGPKIGGAFACASDKEFVFLGNDGADAKLTIDIAEPH